jgi:hypothetical protein
MLDVLLALERCGYGLVLLKVYQRLDVVPLGEALGQPLAMLIYAPY